MLASLFTVGVYLLGHLSRDLRQLGEQAKVESIKPVADFLFRALPDMESFNRTIEAVHQLPIPASEVGWAVLYGLGYATGLLICASYLFARRDFR